MDFLQEALDKKITGQCNATANYCAKVITNVGVAVQLYSELKLGHASVDDKLELLNLIASWFDFKFILVKRTLMN